MSNTCAKTEHATGRRFQTSRVNVRGNGCIGKKLPVSRGWRCLSGAHDRDRGIRGSDIGAAFRVALKRGRLGSHGLYVKQNARQSGLTGVEHSPVDLPERRNWEPLSGTK